MLEKMNRFEELLKSMNRPGARPGASAFRDALIDVADTASMCKMWFDSEGIAYTAADVVAMARLVLEREPFCHDRLRRERGADDDDGA